jgi:flagellar hook-length control protein FliK
MNDPTIDNLFASSVPRPDVIAALAPRRSDDVNEFDDHLRQAGTPANSPTSDSWWRAAADRTTSDERSFDSSSQPTYASLSMAPPVSPPPAPPSIDRSSQPALDQSGSASPSSPSSSLRPAEPTTGGQPNANTRPADANLSCDYARDTAAAASSNAAQRPPAKPTQDRPPSENNPASETTGVHNQSGKRPAKRKPADAPTAKAASDASEKAQVTTATANASPAASADSKQEIKSAVEPSVDAKSAADNAERHAPIDPAAIAKLDAANKQNSAATAVNAAGATAAAGGQLQAQDARDVADKLTDKSTVARTTNDKATAAAKQLSSATAPGAPAAVKPATGAATAGSKSAPTSSDQQGVTTATPKTGVKQDTGLKDTAKSDDAQANDTAKVASAGPRAFSSNPAPAVAAVTAASAPDKSAAKSASADVVTKVAKITSAPKSATLAAFGRLDRSGGATASGPGGASETQNSPTVDPAKFVSRVAKAIETAQNRGGPLSLRLSPPELGSLRLELEVKQGVMNAKVETDTAAARQTLLDNLPSLRDRLAEQNVRIDRFDVDVRRDGTNDQANPGPQQRHSQHQQQYYRAPPTRPTTTNVSSNQDDLAEPTPAVRTITDTTINLVA